MKWLCSKNETGQLLWAQFVEAQHIGIGELLILFPSCTPPLSMLVTCAGSLPPRFYSIASSPLLHGTNASVALSLVHYTCGLTAAFRPHDASVKTSMEAPKILRAGLCSSYLESILGSWLRPNQQSSSISGSSAGDVGATPRLRVFHKPSITFRLPGSVAPPLILIGPGTGVAPFIGFLEHRAQIEKERLKSSDETTTGVWRGGFELEEEDLPSEPNQVGEFIQGVTPGSIHLFFGCRGPHDYLYKSTLEKRLSEGILTTLEVAMSRVGPEKVYVTHKIISRGAETAKLIMSGGAYIYVCGDGNSMAKDVFAAIRSCLHEHGSMTEKQADDMLQDMRQRRRYVLDIWS